MTVRAFITTSLIALVIGGASFAGVVTQLDPEQAGTLGFILIFLSLFITVASAAGLVGYSIRRVLVRRQFPAYAVRTSLRQAITAGAFVSFLLFLQLLRLYRWWIALGLIALLACLEVVFLSYGRSHQRHLEGARDEG
jgi:Ca2+/Na+ antiporter